MTRLEIIEHIENQRRLYRSIGYSLMNGNFWSKEDVIQLLNDPDSLHDYLKGKTRERLVKVAKELKIKDYSRKTVVNLMDLIDKAQHSTKKGGQGDQKENK